VPLQVPHSPRRCTMATSPAAVSAFPVVQPGGTIQGYPNLNPIATQASGPAIVDGVALVRTN